MNEQEIDNSMETFMTLFNKMFSETKYNLQALNKRMESMDKCFNNILLLNTDKPFDEIEENNDDNNNNNENNENINNDNIQNNQKNNYNKKKHTGKMTSKELDEIEKMFKDIEEPTENYNTFFIGKKRNNKKNIQTALGTDPKNYYHDIQELLKNYSLDNDNDNNNKNDENKKIINKSQNKIDEFKKDENKKKGKRGRKKKNIKEENGSLESNADVDYLVPEKNDGYTKFKEFKELKKQMNSKKDNKFSDEEEIDDDLDSDF